jgi:regulator of sigma D
MQKRTLKEQLEAFKKTVESWHSRKDMELLTVKAAARHMLKAYEEIEAKLAEVADKMENFYDDKADVEIPMDECYDTLRMFSKTILAIPENEVK